MKIILYILFTFLFSTIESVPAILYDSTLPDWWLMKVFELHQNYLAKAIVGKNYAETIFI